MIKTPFRNQQISCIIFSHLAHNTFYEGEEEC